jgi:predicted small lipoprotein YifL
MQRFGSRYFKPLCLVLGIVVLGGCGKRGPLYLPDTGAAPDKAGTQTVVPAATQPGKK